MSCGCISAISWSARDGRVRAPAGRLRLLRQIRTELVAGLEQFLLVDDVVAVEDGAALVAGQEHGDPLGDAGADQVAGGGAAAIVEEAGRHAGRLTGGAPRGAQRRTGMPSRWKTSGLSGSRRARRRARASAWRAMAVLATSFIRDGCGLPTPPFGSRGGARPNTGKATMRLQGSYAARPLPLVRDPLPDPLVRSPPVEVSHPFGEHAA